ncbi:MAG: FecR domain-containing protein, partial [Flavobacteriaceae bacterium]|nr:FecR domain-containing protein [Flavobacteriaceae bacterium]
SNLNNIPAVNEIPIVPGTEKAILTLEDGKQVELEKGRAYINSKVNSDGENLIYNREKSDKGKNIVYNYLTIPRGGQFFVQLSDGTKVWLNSESKLKYPVSFDLDKTRNVELLYGEAYFDVSESAKHNGASFKVKTKVQDIEVLGTEFNVKSYNDDNIILTTLIEGKVKVSNGVVNKLLKPGFQTNINIKRNDINVFRVDVDNVVAWKNGFFSFEKERLEDMLKTLSRWYSTKIIYENENKKDLIFSGVLKRTSSIEELLIKIEKTGRVQFKIDKKTITVK